MRIGKVGHRERWPVALGFICLGSLTFALGLGRYSASIGIGWIALGIIMVLDQVLAQRGVAGPRRTMARVVLVVLTVCCVTAAEVFLRR